MAYQVGDKFTSKYGDITLIQSNVGYKEYPTGRSNIKAGIKRNGHYRDWKDTSRNTH